MDTIRKEPPMVIYDDHILTSFDAVDHTVRVAQEAIAAHCPNFDGSTLFKINFMLREMLNNAVEHGNKFDENKNIHCKIESLDDRIVFHITDEGEGIVLKDGCIGGTCLENKSDRNRGFATVKQLDFNVDIHGNTVSLSLVK